MTSIEMQTYVGAVAKAVDLRLDDERIHAVALHLERTLAMASQLDGQALAPADEPAELFRPAPFPARVASQEHS